MGLAQNIRRKVRYLATIFRLFVFGPENAEYLRKVRRSGLFDKVFYRQQHPQLLALFLWLPERHYILLGEQAGFFPRPDFSPQAYLRLNPDVAATGMPPFRHYIEQGRAERRPTRDASPLDGNQVIEMPEVPAFSPLADIAIVVHVHYPHMWPEIEQTIRASGLEFDLIVTITAQGEESTALAETIGREWPGALVLPMPNHGRDIFPWVHLIGSGVLSGYRAVCKLHTKRSPQLEDGAEWRRRLIQDILPGAVISAWLEDFLADPQAGILVAPGNKLPVQCRRDANRARTEELLRRVGFSTASKQLSFPAGSMYWLKPEMIRAIGQLDLAAQDFEIEQGATDGTTAHAFERVMGYLAHHAGLEIRETPGS
ncbi:MAG: rhamnan synthesis F family protein [Xanthomonadales bacterium]|nr:rhamnan synthesis F family protein [Xanthomonadales bacterium]